MRPGNDSPLGWTPFMKAVLVNLSILCVWYLAEYAQFGELQMDRKADDIVFVLYFMATWALFRAVDRARAPRGGKDQDDR